MIEETRDSKRVPCSIDDVHSAGTAVIYTSVPMRGGVLSVYRSMKEDVLVSDVKKGGVRSSKRVCGCLLVYKSVR